MTRIIKEELPPGLRVLVHRDDSGELVITVSTTLTAAEQRRAVRLAVTAARKRHGRRAAIALPAAALTMTRVRRAISASRERTVTAGAIAASAAAVTAAVLAIALMPPGGPDTGGAPAGGQTLPFVTPTGIQQQPPHRRRRIWPHRASRPGSASTIRQAGNRPTRQRWVSRPEPQPESGSATPVAPSPQPSAVAPTSPAAPAPAPSGTRPAPPRGVCLGVLVLGVCVTL